MGYDNNNSPPLCLFVGYNNNNSPPPYVYLWDMIITIYLYVGYDNITTH